MVARNVARIAETRYYRTSCTEFSGGVQASQNGACPTGLAFAALENVCQSGRIEPFYAITDGFVKSQSPGGGMVVGEIGRGHQEGWAFLGQGSKGVAQGNRSDIGFNGANCVLRGAIYAPRGRVGVFAKSRARVGYVVCFNLMMNTGAELEVLGGPVSDPAWEKIGAEE